MSACVGFADCPCPRCRAERVTATAAHPTHTRGQSAYCGACRTIERARYVDVRRVS